MRYTIILAFILIAACENSTESDLAPVEFEIAITDSYGYDSTFARYGVIFHCVPNKDIHLIRAEARFDVTYYSEPDSMIYKGTAFSFLGDRNRGYDSLTYQLTFLGVVEEENIVYNTWHKVYF